MNLWKRFRSANIYRHAQNSQVGRMTIGQGNAIYKTAWEGLRQHSSSTYTEQWEMNTFVMHVLYTDTARRTSYWSVQHLIPYVAQLGPVLLGSEKVTRNIVGKDGDKCNKKVTIYHYH